MIRWYLVKASDNETIHDLGSEGETSGSVLTFEFPAKVGEYKVIRLDASLAAHARVASLTFPISEAALSRDNEKSHFNTNFSALPQGRRKAISDKLAEIGFNPGESGTVKDFISKFLNRFPRNLEK
jgi:hypothetical protein